MKHEQQRRRRLRRAGHFRAAVEADRAPGRRGRSGDVLLPERKRCADRVPLARRQLAAVDGDRHLGARSASCSTGSATWQWRRGPSFRRVTFDMIRVPSTEGVDRRRSRTRQRQADRSDRCSSRTPPASTPTATHRLPRARRPVPLLRTRPPRTRRDAGRPEWRVDWRRFGDDALGRRRVTSLPTVDCVGFGHSMGGSALLMAAHRDPDRFDRLVLFEPISHEGSRPTLTPKRRSASSRSSSGRCDAVAGSHRSTRRTRTSGPSRRCR